MAPTVFWEVDGPNPPNMWESPLSGGMPYENGPLGGVWKAADVAPMFSPGLVPELDEGLPPAADVPAAGGLFKSPLMLDSNKFLARGFIRDSRLNEFVISSRRVSVSEFVRGDPSSL